MYLLTRPAVLLLCAFLWASTASAFAKGYGETSPERARGGGQNAAAQAQTPSQPVADAGKEILTRKCFQCHAATMWGSLRQDRKAWESTLYRMVGRGALWTEAEISAMASFLAETRGLK